MPKKKGMNRTAGTARRKMSAAERVSYGLKTGAPLTGSASGVKSISLRQAGEVLTQGIVSARGKKLAFDPAGLAMALPIGKVLKARNALALGGKITKAVALDERLAAKAAGKAFGQSLAERKAAGGGPIFEVIKNVGGVRRAGSQSVFPRGTDLAKRALKAEAEKGAAVRESMKYEFPFDRFVHEASRIERKYGLNERTAEEGIRQAKKLKGK